MKQNSFGFILVVAAVAAFTSCKKDDADESLPAGYMSAKVDGVSWVADGKSFVAILYPGNFNLSAYSMEPYATPHYYIDFWISGSTTGSYILSAASGNKGVYSGSLIGEFDSNYSINPGSLIITQVDSLKKTVSGTFAFTGIKNSTSDSVVVSSGIFSNIKYRSF